jgi:sterol 24-C-methyltransferase
MLRLFFVVAYIPYLIIRFLGLQAYFVNAMAGVESYRGRKIWRYIGVSARKPLDGETDSFGVRQRKNLDSGDGDMGYLR